MIGALPPLHPPAYTLTEDLRELSEPASIRRPAPDELAREELLLRKLGPRGWGRVHHFRNYYESGWGEHAGRVLSPMALEAFFRFLASTSFPTGKTAPSVFLTDRGGVELCWENAAGRSVQVEFTREGVEFYDETTGEEGVVGHDASLELSRRLSS